MTSIQSQVTLQLPAGWEKQLPTRLLLNDIDKMDFVVDLAAWNSADCEGGPFGAAVFNLVSHELVSIGVNRVVPDCCSLAHAEALAIALAQQQINSFQLASGGSFGLFTSGQPCVQCFGMLWWSGITRLVTAASASDIEELTDFNEGPLIDDWQMALANRPPLNPITVTEGVLRERARSVLRNYRQFGGTNYSPVQQTPKT